MAGAGIWSWTRAVPIELNPPPCVRLGRAPSSRSQKRRGEGVSFLRGENARFRTGCKPSSVCPVAGGENHLSQRPYPKSCPEGRGAGSSWISYLVLHPMGLAMPPRLLLGRWALTPPFHPYPAETRRFVFCGAFRRDASRRRLPRVSRAGPGLRGIVPYGVRTFLPRVAEACGSDSPPIRNRAAGT